MKSVIKGIVLFFVLAVVAIVGGAYILPPQAHVERAMLINAPAEKIFRISADLKRFNDWSPWFELDPKANYTIEGPNAAVGQKMSWASADPKVGKGSQTLKEVVANEKVVSELDMGEMGKAQSTMTFSEVSGGTLVTWSFDSPLAGVMERWMGLMFDHWVGADYERGLTNLRAVVDKEATES